MNNKKDSKHIFSKTNENNIINRNNNFINFLLEVYKNICNIFNNCNKNNVGDEKNDGKTIKFL